MKVKGKVKRLFSAIGLACASVACATVGLIGLERAPVANAADETLETTYLTGIRSSGVDNIRFFWRVDGADLGYDDYEAVGTAEVDYTSGGSTATKTVTLKYTSASRVGVDAALGRTSPRNTGAVESKHPVLMIADLSGKSGDSFTIPEGTTINDTNGTATYELDQDYTVTFNGTNWLLTDSEIPVTLSGARGGSGRQVYIYGLKNFVNYYVTDVELNESLDIEYHPVSGEPTTIKAKSLKPETPSAGTKVGNKPALMVTLNSAVSVGDAIVLKKGTGFDNFAFDCDYKLTYIAESKWSMEGIADEDTSTITLTKRGGNASTLQVWTPNALPFENEEEFAKNVPVYVNGEKVYASYMQGLPMDGATCSFAIRLPSNLSADDVVKLPKNMVINGYKLAETTLFQWSGSAWSLVTCDGTNHIFDDDYTCHDRECACGEVSKATTDHTFESDAFVCQERVCTTCGDAVAAVDHTFESGMYACQDRICMVCSQNVDGDPTAHVPAGSGCEQTCENCQETLSVHEFPQAPAEGWTADNDAVTEVTAPDCINKGTGTVKCNNCDATDEVELNALGHNVPDGEKYCNRGDCDYRIPYTEADMAEVLALNDLIDYTYSNSHPVDGDSTLGSLNRTPDAENENLHSNDFLINTAKGESGYAYEQGKESVHNMTVSFSVTLTEWAADGRSSYVWLNAHENGSWGIGFMFCFYQGAQNLRVIYKPTDGREAKFVDAKALTGFALNEKQSFKLGVVQNSDGSFFVFAYYNGELFLTGTLSNEILTQYANAASHNGLGGAVAFRFNGNAATPAALGTICDTTCSVEGTQYACKDYQCKICQSSVAHTEEHSWGEGEKTGEGSCTEPEKYTKTCGVCGDTATYDGKLVHTWDTDNPTYVQKAECVGVDARVTYGCSLCDATSDEITLVGTGIAGPHDMQYAPVTNATCSAGGTEQGTCTKCGVQEPISDTPANPDAHVYGTEIAGESASCTTDGTKAHYQCTLCEKLFLKEGEVYTQVTTDDLVIKAAHTYVKVDAVAATATADGVAEHYKCSVCNKLFTKSNDTYTEVTADDLKVEYVAPESSSGDSSASDSSASDSSASDSSEEKSGCGSYTSAVGALACLLVCGAAVTLARKRKN